MSKDVIIAGALAVGCVALIAAAFLLPKSKPAEEPVKPEVVTTESLPADPLATPITGDAGSTSAMGLPPTPGFGPAGTAAWSNGPGVAPGSGTPGFSTPAFGQNPATHGFDVQSPLPGPAPIVTPTAEPASATEAKTHVVANGELLGDIAQKYYGSAKAWKKIAAANPGMDPKHLKVGQKLVIPADDAKKDVTGAAGTTPALATSDRTYTVKKGDTYYSIARHELGNAKRWKEVKSLNGNADLHVGHSIKLPAAAAPAAPSASGATDAGTAGKTTHVVAKGELLTDIAKKYLGSSREWRKIVAANPGVSPENLKVGQKLVIPVDDAKAAAPSASATTPGAPAAAAPATGEYVVQAGDTPRTIASKLLGSKNKAQAIIDANPGINPSNLRVGQKLKIPGGAAPTVTTPAAPVAPAPLHSATPAFPAPAVPGTGPASTGPSANNPFQTAPPTGNDFGSPSGPTGFDNQPGGSPFAEPGKPVR